MTRQILQRCILFATTLLLLGSAAQATISHTWVSSTGSDTNACTRSAPCATFAGALAKTSAGGEIDVVDSGDYGPVTISQAVSIEAAGVLATIQVSSGNGITVTAGLNDVVVLRGLTLDGQGAANDGINFSTGASLYVENCRIQRFSNAGIDFLPNGVSKLFVTDTITRNNGASCGVYIQVLLGGFATVSIDGLRTENNACGVKTVDTSNVTIRNSVAANNKFAGFSIVQIGGVPQVLIESSITTHNGTYGVLCISNPPGFPFPVVRLSNVTVSDNQIGLGALNSGVIISFGNNKVDGNGTNGSPTSTIPPV